MTDNKKTGLVAAILNEREIAINLGQEQGVTVGMKFKVLEHPRKVIDPVTGQELGIVTREKIRVKITDVQPKLSIARTYETFEVRTGGGSYPNLWNAYRFALQSAKIETRVRTLRQDDFSKGYGALEEFQSIVKIGDPVESLEDDSSEQ